MRNFRAKNLGETTMISRTPRRASAVLLGVLLALCFSLVSVSTVEAQTSPATAVRMSTLTDINEYLSAGQMREARQGLDALKGHRGTNPDILYLEARYEFFDGDYKKALEILDQAIANAGFGDNLPQHWSMLRELVASTGEVTKDYVKYTSPKGYFEIFVPPGKDRVLVPFAGEALDRAYDEIGEELGFRPPTPIRLEIYPQTSVLAKVSSLSEEEIRTSGTIALCKYNRLMVTSPRALLRGYGWVDTVVHEYVHYVISAKTRNRVPIWMHEGLAKYLERRWRGPDAHRLAPSSEGLLKKRLKKNDLITFEQMHPSMAKLPSQEDAAVAFAEVFTVMEYLQQEVGADAFEKLLDAVNEGLDARQAFAQTIGKPFPTFEREWKAYLKTRQVPDLPDEDGYEEKLVFKDEKKSESEANQIEIPRAREYMQLGELMQARDRCKAALVEYDKAAHLLGDKNPMLQTRRAQCLLTDERAAEALAMLEPVHKTYPDYVQIWIQMGSAALMLKQYDKALEYLREAARINPFDPAVHGQLAEAYSKLGDETSAEEYRKFEKLVR